MQQAIAFVQAHSAIFSAALVAILDFLFVLSPKTEANGILHLIYVTVAKKEPNPPGPSV